MTLIYSFIIQQIEQYINKNYLLLTVLVSKKVEYNNTKQYREYMAKNSYLLDLDKDEIFYRATKDSYFWHEIMEKLSFYINSNYKDPKSFKNVFTSSIDFKQLEELKINYNYKDNLGNNFLRFIFENCHNRYIELAFLNNALDYIIEKTDDIYYLNNNNENLLFSMIEPRNAGLNGEEFFKFIKRFPKFDLHQKNKLGQNLINKAIFLQSDENIINYLIENNLSINHIDNNGNNLISNMIFSSYNKQNISLFNYLFDKNDITLVSSFEENALDIWLKQVKRDKLSHSGKQAVKWINLFLTNCIEKDLSYEYRTNILDYIENNYEKISNVSSNTCLNIKKAKSTLLSRNLETNLISKPSSSTFKI